MRGAERPRGELKMTILAAEEDIQRSAAFLLRDYGNANARYGLEAADRAFHRQQRTFKSRR